MSEALKTELLRPRESGVYFSNYFSGESSCVTGISQVGNSEVDMLDSSGHSQLVLLLHLKQKMSATITSGAHNSIYVYLNRADPNEEENVLKIKL